MPSRSSAGLGKLFEPEGRGDHTILSDLSQSAWQDDGHDAASTAPSSWYTEKAHLANFASWSQVSNE
eukprot:2867032-Rhodomonas_salina.1